MCVYLCVLIAQWCLTLRDPMDQSPPGSSVSMGGARGSASLLSSQGRGIGPHDGLKKDSRCLSRVAAGNPGFP